VYFERKGTEVGVSYVPCFCFISEANRRRIVERNYVVKKEHGKKLKWNNERY
jgi:hypothetical protein